NTTLHQYDAKYHHPTPPQQTPHANAGHWLSHQHPPTEHAQTPPRPATWQTPPHPARPGTPPQTYPTHDANPHGSTQESSEHNGKHGERNATSVPHHGYSAAWAPRQGETTA